MVLGILGAAIGLIVLTWWWHGRQMKTVRARSAWPTVAATIQSSAVRQAEERDEDGRLETVYYPDVAYRYVVGGNTYDTATITPGSLGRGQARQSQAICDRYPSGGQVQARYNPASPDEAYLEIPKADIGLPITLTLTVAVVAFFAIGSVAGA